MKNSNFFSCVYKHILKALIFLTVQIWSLFEAVLFVGGFIVCLMLPVVWPMKFVYAALWLVVFYVCLNVIGVLEKSLARKKSE